MPKQKRPFKVEIEAKVTVLAFDEASARKKVTATDNHGTDDKELGTKAKELLVS